MTFCKCGSKCINCCAPATSVLLWVITARGLSTNLNVPNLSNLSIENRCRHTSLRVGAVRSVRCDNWGFPARVNITKKFCSFWLRKVLLRRRIVLKVPAARPEKCYFGEGIAIFELRKVLFRTYIGGASRGLVVRGSTLKEITMTFSSLVH